MTAGSDQLKRGRPPESSPGVFGGAPPVDGAGEYLGVLGEDPHPAPPDEQRQGHGPAWPRALEQATPSWAVVGSYR
jgi:hypothetical protein